MKSKLRSIAVDNRDYLWSVQELDPNRVLLKVWLKGDKRAPWFLAERRFDNPWHLIGLAKADTIDRLQLQPVTPKLVAAAIRSVERDFGPPEGGVANVRVTVDAGGTIEPR
ncbi:MAG: hypothetical protein AAFZ58_09345 [Pseudomonadota bacterium]